jgi:hypothetical protein
MATTRETIDHVTLSHLVEAGAVHGANVIGQPGGWAIVIKYGMTERALAAKRGSVRTFRKFETLVSYLKGIGVAKYQVDAAGFDPVALKLTRNNEGAQLRLKAAHQAAAFDKHFRQEVAEGIKEADDPSLAWVAHKEVKADMATQRARLKAQIEAAKQ